MKKRISPKVVAIYREQRKGHAKPAPGKPSYSHRKVKWGEIRTKDELEALYKRVLPELRRIAYASGYGLGVHGSMRRDLDLIAVPWTDKAVEPNVLARRMQLSLSGMKQKTYDWTEKPHGRRAATIVFAMNAFIDLSITPKQ